MHTVTIEILRLGTPHNYNLSGDHRYIALCGSYPAIEFSIACDQLTFNRQLWRLRYNSTDEERNKAIHFLQDLLGKTFDAFKPLSQESTNAKDWLHLRLIATPKELAQLPFELALAPEGIKGEPSTPFLLNPTLPTTLTREVRQVSTTRYLWPSRTRILYAWAEPNTAVPHKEHFDALLEILKPLAPPIEDNEEPIPDLSTYITVLRKANLDGLTQELKEGISTNKPYTHIHLLAHGIKERDQITGAEEFKMVLHDNNDTNQAYSASGYELAASILAAQIGGDALPAIVSLMTCDSGQGGSIISPSGSIAHELHEAGIPCIFASQFPLSIPGSKELVACLYKKMLLECEDPRKALYHTRMAINDNRYHDWASLVAYVRLPEDIDLQLEDTKLKMLFSSMYTSNKWTDHVLQYKEKIDPLQIESIYADVMSRLDNSITGLLGCLKDGYSMLATPDLKAEHLGLLGSGYKRKAEHSFRMAEINPYEKPAFLKEANESLIKAKDFYYKGFNEHPLSHWNAMQYLSLKAVLEGTLRTDEEIWTVIKFMAEKVERSGKQEKEKAWTWGTLAELYLLKPLTGSLNHTSKFDAMKKAKEYAHRIKNLADSAVNESTVRQLNRYINWWPAMYPEKDMVELKEMAKEIRDVFWVVPPLTNQP